MNIEKLYLNLNDVIVNKLHCQWTIREFSNRNPNGSGLSHETLTVEHQSASVNQSG